MSYFNHLRTRISPLQPLIVPVGLTVLTFIFIENNLASVSYVNGRSMSPTLSPLYHTTGARDLILIMKRDFSKLLGSTKFEVRRGDVVVFWKPQDPENLGIKRVLALEGDVVARDSRRVGTEHSYGKGMGMAEVPAVLQVPKNHVWIEGDNWRDSRDSNDFGPISKSLIVGKAVGILWPYSRFGEIPTRHEKDTSRTIVRPGMLPPDENEVQYGLRHW